LASGRHAAVRRSASVTNLKSQAVSAVDCRCATNQGVFPRLGLPRLNAAPDLVWRDGPSGMPVTTAVERRDDLIPVDQFIKKAFAVALCVDSISLRA
jgi:hypothetical protein